MPGRRLVFVLATATAVAVTACGSDDGPILVAGGTTTSIGDVSQLAVRTPADGDATGAAEGDPTGPGTDQPTPPTLSGDEPPTSATPGATATEVAPPDPVPGEAPDAGSAPGDEAAGDTAAAVTVATEEELALGEARGIDRVNELRASLGLAAVARDPELDAFARQWSQHMAETGELVHSDGVYGENIAFSSDLTLTPDVAADRFHDLWAASPDHHANMTSDVAVKAGMGLYRTELGWYATYVFSY